MNRTDVQTTRSTSWVVLAVLAAIVVSIAVNTGIALATKSLDAGGTQIGLMPVAYGPATALGIVVATIGWATVRRRGARPAALLRLLVPVVLVVSFVPGVILIVVGHSALNVVGLWVMHLVVTAVTVTMLSRALPVADTNAGVANSYA
ncbi:MAG TPA: DUF6069 family protein [Pseudonocardiaceae bacterium]|jgi:hypothetical protein